MFPFEKVVWIGKTTRTRERGLLLGKVNASHSVTYLGAAKGTMQAENLHAGGSVGVLCGRQSVASSAAGKTLQTRRRMRSSTRWLSVFCTLCGAESFTGTTRLSRCFSFESALDEYEMPRRQVVCERELSVVNRGTQPGSTNKTKTLVKLGDGPKRSQRLGGS